VALDGIRTLDRPENYTATARQEIVFKAARASVQETVGGVADDPYDEKSYKQEEAAGGFSYLAHDCSP
jgi:hypothetical protein